MTEEHVDSSRAHVGGCGDCGVTSITVSISVRSSIVDRYCDVGLSHSSSYPSASSSGSCCVTTRLKADESHVSRCDVTSTGISPGYTRLVWFAGTRSAMTWKTSVGDVATGTPKLRNTDESHESRFDDSGMGRCGAAIRVVSCLCVGGMSGACSE